MHSGRELRVKQILMESELIKLSIIDFIDGKFLQAYLEQWIDYIIDYLPQAICIF